MTVSLPAPVLERLGRAVGDRTGLHFPPERWADLERGVRALAVKAGHASAEACAQSLLAEPPVHAEIEALAGELTVGETYFFREKRSFEVLAETVLPGMVRDGARTGRSLRLWSAGCCSGEEAYSLAILLDRFFPDAAARRGTVLGTDLNPAFLRKARDGVFSEWSFRDAPPWLKPEYFRRTEDRLYEILPRLRERVTFGSLNLAGEGYPALANGTNAMDLILCRNVLMYFTPQKAAQVVEHFHRCLVEGGMLIVSPTEISSQLFASFTAVEYQHVIFYRKDAKPAATLEIAAPAPSPAPARAASGRVASKVPVARSVAKPAPPKPGRFEQALDLFGRGDYASAAEMLQTDPAFPAAARDAALLARICANLGRLDEARDWVETALGLDKLDAGLHFLRALILQEQGAAGEAEAALKRTLYLDPRLVLAHMALGNHALRQGRAGEAAHHFANVLALLADYQSGDILPQSDGLPAGKLKEMVTSAMSQEQSA
ncbi:MAG: CheR family methyltransferase [Verrucomicrobiota bacterium]